MLPLMANPRGNILITGASTGIGFSTAIHLAQEGYQVFGSVRRPKDAEFLAAATPAHAAPIRSLLFDVTDTEAVHSAAQNLRQELGQAGLHALINNAGVAIAGPLEYIPEDEFIRQMDINVFGMLRCTQAFLPLLKIAQGRILNLSSVAGRLAFPLAGPYHSSKHAVEGFSDVLRLELRRHQIQVIVIQPGAIRTPIWQTAQAKAAEIQASLPPQALREYGRLFEQVGKASARAGAEGDEPQLCAKIIAHALQARKPRTRYVVGRPAKIGLFLRRILSDRAMDRLVGKGLDLAPRKN